MSGRSQYNPDANLANRIKKANDVRRTVNYTDSGKTATSSVVYYSAKLGYTLTETLDNSGLTTLVITKTIA